MGGGCGKQIKLNTGQIAVAYGKRTMTGLYSSVCLCNFIINVSELSFCCVRLSI